RSVPAIPPAIELAFANSEPLLASIPRPSPAIAFTPIVRKLPDKPLILACIFEDTVLIADTASDCLPVIPSASPAGISRPNSLYKPDGDLILFVALNDSLI